jgi:hypothetical protein
MIILPIIYDTIGEFNDKYVTIYSNKKWGVIDKKGKIVLPIIYDYIGELSEDKIEVRLVDGFIWI